MMHDDDDALVEGDPEEGPVHLELGSDSDVLISPWTRNGGPDERSLKAYQNNAHHSCY